MQSDLPHARLKGCPGCRNLCGLPKRTGHNKRLFAELAKQDACDPRCYQARSRRIED